MATWADHFRAKVFSVHENFLPRQTDTKKGTDIHRCRNAIKIFKKWGGPLFENDL